MYYPPAVPYQAPGKYVICLQSYCAISKNTASVFLQPVTNLYAALIDSETIFSKENLTLLCKNFQLCIKSVYLFQLIR